MGDAEYIPAGFHTVTPYLVVKGADRAIAFYKAAFGAEELYRHTCSKTHRIMNAKLCIGDSMVMLNDEFPEHGCVGPSGEYPSPVSIHLYVANVDSVYDRAVDSGAESLMPVSDTFWGDRYGQLRDPFGHKWSIATHVEDVTPEEIQKRAQQAFS